VKIQRKINFIHLGPGKTGSKWLSKVLKKHPHIFVPGIDIYFFDRSKFYKKGLGWYHSFFKDSNETHTAIGELSHDYIHSEIAAKRIKKYNPDIKLIITLRNPADLCNSIYHGIKISGFDSETSSNVYGKSYEESLESNTELLKFGLYAKKISFYIENFKREDILILNYDELIIDKKEYLKKIFDFLNVENLEDLANTPAFNVSKNPRIKILGIIAKKTANLFRVLNLFSFLAILKNSQFIKDVLFKENIKKLSEKSRKKIVRKYFIDDIKQLEKKSNLDLHNWYQ
jgi:hypothetical protein